MWHQSLRTALIKIAEINAIIEIIAYRRAFDIIIIAYFNLNFVFNVTAMFKSFGLKPTY